MEKTEGGICAAKGFRANGVYCGIRKNKSKRDLALVVCDTVCTAAGVYTRNKVKGAPLLVTRQNLADGKAQALICNSGNANTCNADGEEKARAMCALTARYTGVEETDVIVASTGVIGQVLPLEPIADGMAALCGGLSAAGADAAAQAIMTTDTVSKQFAYRFTVGGKTCTVGAMAKGSGMIHPNMATMLCFVTTDAAISAEMLRQSLHDTVEDTVNMVSVDGDTSTNDMVTIMASGLAGNREIVAEDADYRAFRAALEALLKDVSRALAKDGEGATKLLECRVTGAADKTTAKKIAKSVVCSTLMKAAMFASDANWGRILCAVGYADAEFDIEKIDVDLVSRAGMIGVCRKGVGIPFDEAAATRILKEDEITVAVECGSGDAEAAAWGCDLTYDYVKINAEYRT